jgi:hypothetical protein
MIVLIVFVSYLIITGIVKASAESFLCGDEPMWFAVFWPVTVPYIMGTSVVKAFQNVNLTKAFKKKEKKNVSKI